MNDLRFGFLGAGRMATALARGLIEAGLAPREQVLASDPLPWAAEQFHRVTGAKTTANNLEVAAQADVLFLAVKPQQMGDLLAELSGKVDARHLVISIAAGVPISILRSGLGDRARLVRVMPNTPCLIGAGASAYCLGPNTTAEDGQLVAKLFQSVGWAAQVPEKLLNAVTGLSGSGPAFVYLMIEALSDGGVRMGLSRDVATALAAHTLRGAAEMVLKTGEHPGALKDQVASPAGTTIAGLQKLEEHGVRAGLMAAVEAATLRSAELGEEYVSVTGQRFQRRVQ